MSREIINVGNTANDGAGDPLRTAMIKTNNNFSEIYDTGLITSNLSISNTTVTVTSANANLVLSANGTGVLQSTSNILPSGNIILDIGSNSNRFAAVYANSIDISGTADVVGNLSAGNLETPGNLTAGAITVSGNVSFANTSVQNITVTETTTTNNISVTNTVTADTVTASGNITAENISANVFLEAATVDATGNIEGANFVTSGNVEVTGNVNTNNLIATNDVEVGGNLLLSGLSGFTVFGDISSGTGNIQADTGNIIGNIDSVTATIATINANTVTAADSIQSDGSLEAVGNLTIGDASTITENTIYGNLTVTDILTVDGQIIGNVTISGNADLDIVTANSFQGPLSGNVNGNLTGTASQAFGVYVLETSDPNATYNIPFMALTGAGNIFTGLQVDNGGLTFNPDTNTLSIATGTNGIVNTVTVVASGNISAGNTSTSGTASVTGNITGGNINTGGTVNATGQVTAGNVQATNTVFAAAATITGNISGGNISTAGTVGAAGNISGGNIFTGGIVTATGNISGGNLVTAGDIVTSSGNVDVTGNVNAGNVDVTGNVDVGGDLNFGLGASLNLPLGNITGGNLIAVNRSTANTVQVQGSAPASSVGAAGDQQGDIAVDTNYIYVCTANYDGIANIWKRSALDGTPF